MNERAIFLAALDIDDPPRRAAYVDRACDGDAGLRRQVDDLLKAHQQTGEFMDRPAAALVSTLVGPPGVGPSAVIGPYKLLEQIGEGGFGVVFMAEQTRPVRRRVALKVLKPGMDTGQVVARFEAERQALALMDHPNIAKVYDAGSTDAGRPYFVMELVRGVPVTDFCDTNHLSVPARLDLFAHVCQAVQHAHHKGVIHRDIKPSNVLVTLHDGKPVVKVIDFGVAKAVGQALTEKTLFTGYAQMIGTPLYMSPEQAELSGLDVDTRADVYALGVLLYELLTGTTPFDKERFRTAGYDEIRRIIREEEPARPSTRVSTLGKTAATISASRKTDPQALRRAVRGELDWIVMKCLEKDRGRRYDTASGLAQDVQRYLHDEPVQACPPSAGYRLRKFARRHRGPVAAGLALATLLVLGTVGTSVGLAWALQAERTATAAAAAETRATDDLKQTLARERVEAYFRRIALAHGALSVNDLRRTLDLLDDCPDDLRGWDWRYLMRLCRVEPVILRNKSGVKAEVHGVAFSPDGGWIASAGGDGTVTVWDGKTGQVTKTIPAHAGFASSVAFHADGKHLASVGADNLVKVWDWRADLAPVFARPCDVVHQFGTAYAVAFNPLAPDQLAVGRDGKVTVWDWRNGKPVHTFPGHEKRGISVAFSRDGRRLASGDWAGSVKLWDAVAGGGPLVAFPESLERRHPVSALAFSRDGGQLASASFSRRVDVWDTATGQLVRELPHPGRLVRCVAVSPDGRLIASAGEGKTVHVWDATTGRALLDLRGHTGGCGCVAFSPDPDGLRLASASMDGTIRVWDATPLTGDERQETATFTEQGDEIWTLAVSPDGHTVASAGFGGIAKVWDATTRRVSARFSGHKSVVFGVAWRPDGRRLAFAGGDGGVFTVKVWDPQTEEQDFVLTAGSEYHAVAFSPLDGRYLVTGNAKGLVQVWDARDGREVRTVGGHKGTVRGAVFSRDGRYLASASSDGSVKLWDATRLGEARAPNDPQKPLRTFPVHIPGPCLNVAFSPDGKRLAIGETGYTVKLWDVETGRELTTLRGHNGDIYTVAFSPDPAGRWVASAGEDSTVKVWDSHTGDLLRTFRGHTGLVSSLAFGPGSKDGKWLVSGSRDHWVKVWDLTQLDEGPGH